MAPPAGGSAGVSVLTKLPWWGKLIVGVVLAWLVAFGYWFIFFTDVSKKIDAAVAQQGNLRKELSSQKQMQQDYFADRDELASRQQRARDFNKVLPAEKGQPQFLSAIQQAAATAGVDFKVYQPLEEQPQAFYIKDPMKVEVAGRFHQVAKFMYEVGKLDRIINMENVELTNPKVNGEEVLLSAKCLATAFHTKPPEKAKPAAAPGAPGAQQGAKPK